MYKRQPLVGGVFGTRRELFPEYDAGVYRQDGTTLFVSRGLGYTNVIFREQLPPRAEHAAHKG